MHGILSTRSVAKIGTEAKADLETSLRELATDCIDIRYMHSRDDAAAITDELVRVWEDAKKEAMVRHIGVSAHNPTAIADRVLETGKIEVVLSVYNFAVGSHHEAAFDCLHKAGVGLAAMKAMASAARASGFRGSGRQMEPPGGAAAAPNWVLRDPRFATTIPGMTDMEQLEENFRAMAELFGPKDEKFPAALTGGIRPLYRRMGYGCSGNARKARPFPKR